MSAQRALAFLDGSGHGVDPQQGDAADNERIDRCRQIVATGQPAGRDSAAVTNRAEGFGQRPPPTQSTTPAQS